MFVILVYDVEVRRVAKVLKKCREYLYWVQNSVFEGDISESSYYALRSELLDITDPDHDAIVVYRFDSRRYSEREIIGVKKGGEEFIV